MFSSSLSTAYFILHCTSIDARFDPSVTISRVQIKHKRFRSTVLQIIFLKSLFDLKLYLDESTIWFGSCRWQWPWFNWCGGLYRAHSEPTLAWYLNGPLNAAFIADRLKLHTAEPAIPLLQTNNKNFKKTEHRHPQKRS